MKNLLPSILFFWAALAAAQDCSQTYVRCVGSGQEYSTIQSAADAAVAGDLVYVYNGTYAGFRVVSGHVSGTAQAPIAFQAQSSSVQITTPNSDGNGVTVNLVDYVVINGFTITGMTTFGIDVVECQSCQILNNVVSNSGQSNILTGFAYGVLIQGNTTYGAGGTQHGIYVSNSARPLDAPVVRGNTSYSNSGSGIQFNGDCNTFDHLGNSDGMISGALVENNVIHDNTGPAFSLINLSDSVLRNNLTYNSVSPGSYKLADEGCNLGSNRNLIVNNTMTSATGAAGVRIVSGLANVVYNNIIVTTGFKCVMDDTGTNCMDGNEGNYYLAGLEKTPTQAASGIFVNFAGYNFALTSGSPAIGVGATSFHSYPPPPIDILGNVRPFGGHYDDGAYQYGSTAAGPDTQAPTVPGTPSASAVTPYLVTLAWTASTDNREVLWYYIYRGGTLIGFAATNGYTDSTPSAGASYTYTVAAVDGSSNLSAASSGLAVTVPGQAGCLNADASWRNRAMPTETGAFTWEADVTPYVTTANDGTVGLGQAVPAAYTGLGVLVSFNSSGNIQARNGGAYGAGITLPFSLGIAYHLRIPVNVAAHSYSVYVTPQGGAEQLLASNYAFRTEQAAATSLGYIGVFDDQGYVAACNVAVNGTLLDSMTFASLTPSTSATPILVDVSGTGHPVMDRSTVVNHPETNYTLTEGGGGNRLLRFTANSQIAVTVPAGLTPNQSFTLLQAGSGVIQLNAGAGVTLIQRRGTLRTAGLGAPVTIQSTGVQDEYVIWGDLQ